MNPSSTPNATSCCCGGNGKVATAPAPVSGAFELVDHFGHPVSERSYGERHLLVFFGFSHCAVVCPRELAKLQRAVHLLGSPLAGRVQPLYISVDPARDAPEVLRRYLAPYPAFIGLTGSTEQVVKAKRGFRVFAEPVADADAPGGYVVPHTAFAFLMAPGGRYVAHFADSLDADSVASRIGVQLGEAVAS